MAYIMVLDDDHDFASAAATVLRKDGHEVEIELHPETGFNRMMSRPPDLLILDVMFPENASAGFDIARRVRSSPVLSKLPILLLTAVHQSQYPGVAGESSGEDWLRITEFLNKPLDIETLSATVTALIANFTPRSDKETQVDAISADR